MNAPAYGLWGIAILNILVFALFFAPSHKALLSASVQAVCAGCLYRL